MDKLGTKFDTITSKNGIKYDLFKLDKDTDVDKFLEGKKFKWNNDVITGAWKNVEGNDGFLFMTIQKHVFAKKDYKQCKQVGLRNRTIKKEKRTLNYRV